MTTAAPPVASVVVAFNPHDNDPRVLLDAYVDQTMPAGSFEVIVVVDGDTRADVEAGYREHVRVHPATPVRLVASPRPGRAACNNAGVRDSRAPLLVFVSDDCVPGATLVRAHVEFHRHLQAPAVGIGGSFFAPPLREDPFRRWLEDSGKLFGLPLRIAEHGWQRGFFFVGNASMSRALFDAMDGFDEGYRHDAYEDYDFGVRLDARGVRTHYLPKARARHDHEVTLAEREQAMRRSGIAARYSETRLPGVPPWRATVTRPLAEHRAAVARAEAALRRQSTRETRGDWYAAVLDLAFVESYLAAATEPATATPAG